MGILEKMLESGRPLTPAQIERYRAVLASRESGWEGILAPQEWTPPEGFRMDKQGRMKRSLSEEAYDRFTNDFNEQAGISGRSPFKKKAAMAALSSNYRMGWLGRSAGWFDRTASNILLPQSVQEGARRAAASFHKASKTRETLDPISGASKIADICARAYRCAYLEGGRWTEHTLEEFDRANRLYQAASRTDQVAQTGTGAASASLLCSALFKNPEFFIYFANGADILAADVTPDGAGGWRMLVDRARAQKAPPPSPALPERPAVLTSRLLAPPWSKEEAEAFRANFEDYGAYALLTMLGEARGPADGIEWYYLTASQMLALCEKEPVFDLMDASSVLAETPFTGNDANAVQAMIRSYTKEEGFCVPEECRGEAAMQAYLDARGIPASGRTLSNTADFLEKAQAVLPSSYFQALEATVFENMSVKKRRLGYTKITDEMLSSRRYETKHAEASKARRAFCSSLRREMPDVFGMKMPERRMDAGRDVCSPHPKSPIDVYFDEDEEPAEFDGLDY